MKDWLIFIVVVGFFSFGVSFYKVYTREPTTKQILTEIHNKHHQHNIHCCKSKTLESTYHTYVREDGEVDHPVWCRCYNDKNK